MKSLTYNLLFLIAILIGTQSCVEKEFDWDNLDKNGVIVIPPIPLGSIDTIYLNGLPTVIPGGIPIPDFSIALSDTLKGLFDGNAVKNFFYEGAGAVEISAIIDVDVEIEGVRLEMHFRVIDFENHRINDVVIPKQTLSAARGQSLDIKLDSQYMQYMDGARDLELIIVLISDKGSVWIGEDDYLYIRDAIVKTGGFHFEL